MDAVALKPRIVWLLTLAVAVSRWPAVSRTLWDWDEALFALALRDYDVTLHHPHPPGFPLFIGAAKLVAAITPLDAFHALQCVTVLASLFVFPAMLWLARELELPPFRAIAAALLLSFFPNVWFFGGTAFSDVPSLVLALVASALLLRGRRSDAALIAGAIVLGIAAGFRPQNLMIGFVPFLLAFRQRWRTALLGGAIIAVIVACSYGAAASLSGGWSAYRATLMHHEQYIRQTDSFLAANRPGLFDVADDFFVRPFRATLLNVVLTVLSVIGAIVCVRRRVWLPLLIFGPFLLFAWLYLDYHSSSRFAIGYMPLFALLVPFAIPSRAQLVTLVALLALMLVWTMPALRVAHTTISPPVAAMENIRTTVERTKILYVDERLAAHAELLLPDYERRTVRVVPPLLNDPNAVLLREGASTTPGARNFTRKQKALAGIARKRYFEVSVVPGRRPNSF